jgi:parvulin-like peptidyl-prolyl isomerase
MTTLRTFQTEIEEIHHRELVKQRAQVVTTEEKENKNPQPKGKAKDDSDNDEINTRAGMVEAEEKILVS